MLAFKIIVVVVSINSSDLECQKLKFILKIWSLGLSGDQQWHLKAMYHRFSNNYSLQNGRIFQKILRPSCWKGTMIKVIPWALLSPSGKLDYYKLSSVITSLRSLPAGSHWPALYGSSRLQNTDRVHVCVATLFFFFNPPKKQRLMILCELPSQKPVAVESVLGNFQVSWSLEHCRMLRTEGLAHGKPLTNNCGMNLCHDHNRPKRTNKICTQQTMKTGSYLITFPLEFLKCFHILS